MIAVLLVAVWASLSPAHASDPQAEVLALTRALAYDRRLGARVGEQIRVAVVDDPEDAASVARGREVRDVLERLSPLTIRDVPVVLVGAAGEADVVYVCSDRLPPVLGAGGPVVLGFGREIVQQGAHLGIVEGHDGLRLLVNLPASRAAGLDFSSRLLQVAQVLR